MVQVKSELSNFIIDLDDEDCPHFGLHLAAYQGDLEQLKSILKDPELRGHIDAKVRPFKATPLRLAATGERKCIRANYSEYIYSSHYYRGALI